MKSLVIGGSKGFGHDVSEGLENKGFEVVSVGRSEISDYVCDIGNLENWKEVLEKIKTTHKIIDLIVLVAGFARAINPKDITIADWSEHLSKNLVYVALGLESLHSSLTASLNPKVATVGSQWSYKIGSNELVPYTVSKHALNTLTKDFALRNPNIKINHYCIPTTDTAQYKEVEKSFDKVGKLFDHEELAESKVVAQSLVGHVLGYENSGMTLTIDATGITKEL